jgi:hypothetical protein
VTHENLRIAAECAVRICRFTTALRAEIEDDPEYEASLKGGVDPVFIGLVLSLCNSLMIEDNWENRERLFSALSNQSWPDGVTVRERIDELLNGINLRADYWRNN